MSVGCACRDSGGIWADTLFDCSEVFPYRVCLLSFARPRLVPLISRGAWLAASRSLIRIEPRMRYRHMGISAIDQSRADVDKVIAALKEALAEAKASKNA